MFHSPRRMQQTEPTSPEYHRSLLQAELNMTLSELLNRLMLINFMILLVGAGASYFLSGKTLEPIEQALNQQRQFVADAAHELKTPLTALHTSLEVDLMDSGINKKTRKLLLDNLNEVRRLESLTDKLLKLAHAESSRDNLRQLPVSLNKVVESAINQVKPIAQKRKIKIRPTINLAAEDSLTIRGNQDSLIEMMVILLDNAIKFSDKNSTVTIRLTKQGELGIIEIKDQGIGISGKELNLIFDRFYRVDSSRQKTDKDGLTELSSGGYGLGLSLAKQIAANHRGTIEVESELGKGSTFRVRLKTK